MKNYIITKEFIGGILKGLTCTQKTNVKFNVGFICNNPIGGTSPYKIISVLEVINWQKKI